MIGKKVLIRNGPTLHNILMNNEYSVFFGKSPVIFWQSCMICSRDWNLTVLLNRLNPAPTFDFTSHSHAMSLIP